jgi:hypothetical protein
MPVTTGPWDPTASGVRRNGHLRASDADRERAIDILKAAFVLGMLTWDELDARAGEALGSRTYAELTALTTDLPGTVKGGRPAEPAGNPADATGARARRPTGKKAVAWAACLIVLLPALGAAFLTYYGGFLVLFVFAFLAATITADP